ncbi:MAG: cysteine desulfurase family protein [Candidatus Saccharimonadales bacterium]
MKHQKAVYLDYAAATPVDDQVLKAMQPYWQERFYNPSANYMAGRLVADDLKLARRRVAAVLGSKPTEIIFTAGGTEADNLAIDGIMQQYPQASLLVSAVEHEAILQAAQRYDHKLIPVDKKAVVRLDELGQLIDDNTVLISVMHANNELGSIQPLPKVASLIKKVRQQRQKTGNKLPLYLHSDASQTPNYLAVKVSRLGVDLLTINGGKLYGPKQTGALFVRSGLRLLPVIRGGGQERGLRSGTENLAAIVGLVTALELAQEGQQAESKRLAQLQQLFEAELQKAVPRLVINSVGNRLPNIVHVTIPEADNEQLMMQLDEQGIICAVGSACSASKDEPSHVLQAIGLSSAQAQSSLRFSMGRSTTKEQLLRVVQVLAGLVTKNQG